VLKEPQQKMTRPIESVAIIGAGVSGVAAGAHLKAAGLQVTLFERSNTSGGVWQVSLISSKNQNTNKTPGSLIRDFPRSLLIHHSYPR